MRVWKGHAYGNDFLMMRGEEVETRGADPVALARLICARHTGLGADGLILFRDDANGIRMRLINADGSHAEVSGNGVRCLAALVAHGSRGASAGVSEVVIHTDAGPKRLTPVANDELERRTIFRAAMGRPSHLRLIDVEVDGVRAKAAALSMGNPQCILLDQPLTQETLHRFGPALQHHPEFPQGVNVEILQVEDPRRVRILIWERGVGPTESSGTGSCASAVAAIAYAGAARAVDVAAPGGEQRVEWNADEEVFLTGWAQLVLDGEWML
jgi:diaminopimelate epimerase